MIRVKRREFTGDVCGQIVYNVPDGTESLWRREPRPRFETQQERDDFNAAVSLRRFTKTINCFPPSSLYSTLTLNRENECHDFDEARTIINAYIRVLKYHFPDVKLVAVMGRGKHTHRIHFHMVSDGVSEEYLKRYWKYGAVQRAETLRAHNYYNGVDHGRDYSGLAKYLHDHWTPEQGGRRRWKQTNNLNKPETEKPKIVKRKYTEQNPPRPPKGYKLVDVRAGKYPLPDHSGGSQNQRRNISRPGAAALLLQGDHAPRRQQDGVGETLREKYMEKVQEGHKLC